MPLKISYEDGLKFQPVLINYCYLEGKFSRKPRDFILRLEAGFIKTPTAFAK